MTFYMQRIRAVHLTSISLHHVMTPIHVLQSSFNTSHILTTLFYKILGDCSFTYYFSAILTVNCSDSTGNFVAPKPQIPVSAYYHGSIDRSQALDRIQTFGIRDGVFLVRTSPHKPNVYVLSMAASGNVYNFEIQTKVNNLSLIAVLVFLRKLLLLNLLLCKCVAQADSSFYS